MTLRLQRWAKIAIVLKQMRAVEDIRQAECISSLSDARARADSLLASMSDGALSGSILVRMLPRQLTAASTLVSQCEQRAQIQSQVCSVARRKLAMAEAGLAEQQQSALRLEEQRLLTEILDRTVLVASSSAGQGEARILK
jgi:translation initiation factor 2B subunit (eIF-2B alpha/beta/delta family)